jgi:hypothetical protein
MGSCKNGWWQKHNVNLRISQSDIHAALLESTEALLTAHWGITGLSQLAVLARTGSNCQLAVNKIGEMNWIKWQDY